MAGFSATPISYTAMSFTNWNVSRQISGNPTVIITYFCQPWRDAVQIASGSLSSSTARMVAPIGPMPKKVTAMPFGRQTTCWYFQPVAKITNSVTVAMMSNGSVRYEMRLVFSRCHGENPASRGAAVWEPSEFVEVEFFITKTPRAGLARHPRPAACGPAFPAVECPVLNTPFRPCLRLR